MTLRLDHSLQDAVRALYLDFINSVLFQLRFLGNRRE